MIPQQSRSTVHPLYKPGYVTACVGNLTEEKSCISEFPIGIWIPEPITVAALSKSWTIFARSNTGVVGSNPTRGMDVCVCLFCVCTVLWVGSGLATVWSPVQGVLLTVYRITKLKKRPGPSKGLYSHRWMNECCHVVWSDHRRGFGLDNGFIDHLYTRLGTTSNYSAIANSTLFKPP
jgi:hypothetical protein